MFFSGNTGAVGVGKVIFAEVSVSMSHGNLVYELDQSWLVFSSYLFEKL